MKIISSRILLFIKFGFGVGIIIFFLFWLDINKIIHTLIQIDYWVIVILFINYAVDRLFMAYKWGLIIKSFKHDISFWKLAKAYFYGSFTNQFMPISISGDVVRFYSVTGEGLSKTYLFSSMIIEKIFGFFSIIVASIIAIILNNSPLSNNKHFYNGILISIIIILFFISAAFLIFKTKIVSNLLEKYKGRFKEKITNIVASLDFFSQKKGILIKFFSLSLIEQFFPIFGIFILAHSLGINISFTQALFVGSLGLLLSRLPISPSSIGIQEGAFVGLFILMGMRGESGFALSISARILDMICPLPFILVYFSETIQLLKKSRNKESQLI